MRKMSIWKLLLSLFCTLLPLMKVVAEDLRADSGVKLFWKSVQRCHLPSSDVGDGESVFNRYVQQRLDAALPRQGEPKTERSLTRSALGGLSGIDASIYQALVPMVKEIAAGARTNTQLTIPATGICPTGTFSAAQLGLEKLFVNNELTDEAYARVEQMCFANTLSVVFALIEDYPLEFYWFDKSHEDGFYISPPDIYQNFTAQTITVTGSYKLSLHVAQEYTADGQTSGGYTLDPGKINMNKLDHAIDVAKRIVDDNKSLPSKRDRLKAYFDSIMELVDYNFDAVNNPTPYGNPWQLIWVFDEDPDTKVVCEGYSKAFKYLCDLSQFDDIECLLATGNLGSVDDGIQGPPGPHMWNVVRMDNGYNYLVDVTNGESFGDYLFLLYNSYSEYGPEYGSFQYGYYFIYNGNNNLSWSYDDNCKNSLGEQALTLAKAPYEAPTLSSVKLLDDSNVSSILNNYKNQKIHIDYKRSGLTVGQPATLCLPFAYPIPSINIGKFYSFTGVSVNEVTGRWEAKMVQVDEPTLAANTPYIFVPAFSTVDFSGDYDVPAILSAGVITIGRWSLVATYSSKNWATEGKDYGFTANNGMTSDNSSFLTVGTFVKCAAGASIAPLRCYLSYNGMAGTRGALSSLPHVISIRFVDKAGSITAVEELHSPTGIQTYSGWYDLKGRRLVAKPSHPGIYIQNGQKIKIQ